ncbi:MAG: HAMP domain-containing histidine kinase, partial [Ruminococcus sp.]|nr:HAMP domain-containing histidine kinase [Ruminococcus sp.]
GLEANMDSTPEKRQKYLSVIMRKCDEVSRLTNDLFLHSLSDLDKLQLQPEDIELTLFIKDAVQELSADQGDLTLSVPDTNIRICADKNRLMQICENLINNSRKYAKTDILLTVEPTETEVSLVFKDGGSGIPDEDMPFIFDKFYRGRNCGNEQGSGLGLYIVKYLAEKQGGRIMLRNLSDGFEAAVTLPLKKD